MSITCAPSSGSAFSVGTTTVTCTASDARQRTDTCTFAVVVQAPPRLSVTRFIAFGDSITWGENGASSVAKTKERGIHTFVQFPLPQTYPGELQTELQGRYTTQSPTIANFGNPGEEASDPHTLARFNQALASGQFDVVLLMEGSNDVGSRDATVQDNAIAALDAMVRSAKGFGVKPYLATVPPMLPNTLRGSLAYALVPAFDDRIRGIASSEGIPLVDVFAALNANPPQYIGFDGLHPNVDGYQKIADTFFASIKSTLEVTPTATTTAAQKTSSRSQGMAKAAAGAAPSRGSSGSPPRRRQ